MVERYALADVVERAQVELRFQIALAGRLAVPAGRFDMVLGHCLSAIVEKAKGVFGGCVSSLGGLAVPAYGLALVLANTPAFQIHLTQRILSPSVAPIGSFLERFERFASWGFGGVPVTNARPQDQPPRCRRVSHPSPLEVRVGLEAAPEIPARHRAVGAPRLRQRLHFSRFGQL